MDWWQAGSVMGTVVLATTAVVTISWRVLAGMRQENRAAHDKIGEKITRGCPNRSWRLRWLSVDSCYAATSFPSTGGVPSSSRCALSIQRSL